MPVQGEASASPPLTNQLRDSKICGSFVRLDSAIRYATSLRGTARF